MQTAQKVRDSFNYLSQGELDLLREIVLSLPPNPVIVNIGAGAGTSGLLFLETRSDTIVHTIDIQDESSPFGCLEGERQVVHEAGLGHLWNKRWFQVHGDSKAMADKWNGGEIDLLFVDGDHSYKGCMGDLVTWGRHVKQEGLIAVHDYEKEGLWKSQNPDVEVTDLVRETIIKPYPGVDEAVQNFFPPNSWIALVDSLVVFQPWGVNSVND